MARLAFIPFRVSSITDSTQTNNIKNGEIFVNTADNRILFKNTSGVIVEPNYGSNISLSTNVALAAGTASAGGASTTTASKSDHVHPLQTTVSGNAGTATKLQTARTINGVSFDGSANITIPTISTVTNYAALPSTGQSTGVLYITKDTKIPYYWDGTAYVEMQSNIISHTSSNNFPLTGVSKVLYLDEGLNKIYRWNSTSPAGYVEVSAGTAGTAISYGTSVPSVAIGSGSAGGSTTTTVSKSDHVHPAQTSVSGNAGSADKLKTARTINGVSFDGSSESYIFPAYVLVSSKSSLPTTFTAGDNAIKPGMIYIAQDTEMMYYWDTALAATDKWTEIGVRSHHLTVLNKFVTLTSGILNDVTLDANVSI